jgi:hypothetical protein
MNSTDNGSLSLNGSALDDAISNVGGDNGAGQEQDFAPPGTVAFARQMEELNEAAQGGAGRGRPAREPRDAASRDGRSRQPTKTNADYSRRAPGAEQGSDDRPSADDAYEDAAGTELAAGREQRRGPQREAAQDQDDAGEERPDYARKFLSQFGIGDADADDALEQAADDFEDSLGQFDQVAGQQDDGADSAQQGQGYSFQPQTPPWMQQGGYPQQQPWAPQAPWGGQPGQFLPNPYGPQAPWGPQTGPFGQQQGPWGQPWGGPQKLPDPVLIDDETIDAVAESGGKDAARALKRFNQQAQQQHQAMQQIQQQIAYQQWQAYQAQQQRQQQQQRQGQVRRGPTPQDAAKIYDAVFDQLTDFADVLGHSARGLSPQLRALRKELAANAARVQYVKRQSGVRYTDETALKQAVLAYVRASRGREAGGGGGTGDSARDQRVQSRHRQRDISARRGARGAGESDNTMSEVLSATREFLHGQRGG